jgi:hypothetical protein
MIAMNIGLLAWVIAAAFAVGWFSCYLCRDRTVKKTDSDNNVVPDPDPEYAEWYIRHLGYADGRSTFSVYKQPENERYIPWDYGTFDSFEAALAKLNEVKAKHEANRIVSTRNYIVK